MIGRYSQGKASALVVDIGHQNTSVTALWEGMVLKKSKFADLPASLRPLYDDTNLSITTVYIATGLDETALDRAIVTDILVRR